MCSKLTNRASSSWLWKTLLHIAGQSLPPLPTASRYGDQIPAHTYDPHAALKGVPPWGRTITPGEWYHHDNKHNRSYGSRRWSSSISLPTRHSLHLELVPNGKKKHMQAFWWRAKVWKDQEPLYVGNELLTTHIPPIWPLSLFLLPQFGFSRTDTRIARVKPRHQKRKRQSLYLELLTFT